MPVIPSRATGTRAVGGVAATLGTLLHPFTAGELPVRLRAWDGSETGPAGAPVVVLRCRRALRRLLWDPTELGAARAYVSGDLDVDGDLAEGLSILRRWVRERGAVESPTGVRRRIRALATVARLGALGPRPAPPPEEARMSERLHTLRRDSCAISFHYDLSSEFYELILDPQLAYSCGFWRSHDPSYTIDHAQRDKLDLICRKLALRPGMRLLDVGCGWGSLVLYAARHHGVTATGVTLSRAQRAFVAARAAERGLADVVDVRCAHYRELPAGETPYDAVASIEMGEHVGLEHYPGYAATLRRLVRPRGRVLVQQMTHGLNASGGGAFIERYVAPDMHMRPLADTLGMLEAGGLEVAEVQSLREHYDRTARAWATTLDERWEQAVKIVGEGVARVWRLYLAGGALAFRENRMGVHQILMVRPDDGGDSGLAPVPGHWS